MPAHGGYWQTCIVCCSVQFKDLTTVYWQIQGVPYQFSNLWNTLYVHHFLRRALLLHTRRKLEKNKPSILQ
jgi:hypothetical protein